MLSSSFLILWYHHHYVYLLQQTVNSLKGGLPPDSSVCDWFLACCTAPWVFTDELSQQPADHQAKTQLEGLGWGLVSAVLLSASCLFAFRFCGLFCCAELKWMLRSRCLKNMSMLSAAGSPSANAVSMMTSWHRPRKGGLRVGLGSKLKQRWESGCPI